MKYFIPLLVACVLLASPGTVSAQADPVGVCKDVQGCGPSSGSAGASAGSSAGAELGVAIGQALGAALGNWLRGNPAEKAELERRMRELEARRQEEARLQAEAARLQAEAKALRLEQMFRRLNAQLKLAGLPELKLKLTGSSQKIELKLVDRTASNGKLKLKLGEDGANGYGIPGLPGIYTNGPRVTDAVVGASGADKSDKPPALKLGDEENKPAMPGLPGIFLNGSQETPVEIQQARQLALSAENLSGADRELAEAAALNAAAADPGVLASSDKSVTAFAQANQQYEQARDVQVHASETLKAAQDRQDANRNVLEVAETQFQKEKAAGLDPPALERRQQEYSQLVQSAKSDEAAWQTAKQQFADATADVTVKRGNALQTLRDVSIGEPTSVTSSVLPIDGLPGLALKSGDGSSGQGYGICGLPGLAIQGERPGCPVATGPAPSRSNPGVATNGTSAVPLTVQQPGATPGPGMAAPDQPPLAELPGQPSPLVKVGGSAANELTRVADDSKLALKLGSDEAASKRAGEIFDNGFVNGTGADRATIPVPVPVSIIPVAPNANGSQPVEITAAPSKPGLVIPQQAAVENKQAGQPQVKSDHVSLDQPLPGEMPQRHRAITSVNSFRIVDSPQAAAECGIPEKFVELFRTTAKANPDAIGIFQNVNSAATALLEKGLGYPKPLLMKYPTGVNRAIPAYIEYEPDRRVYDAAAGLWKPEPMVCEDWCFIKDTVIGGKRFRVLADRATGLPYISDLDLLAIAHRNDLERTQHPDQTVYGNLTPADERLVVAYNKTANYTVENAKQLAIVAHGGANLSPTVYLIPPKFPVCAFEPSGEVVSLPDKAELKKYFNSANARGFSVSPDPRWNWGSGPPWQ